MKETIINMWNAWMEIHLVIRFLVYTGIAVLIVGALSGCATSVSYKNGDCSTKMTGLFLAHGLAPANVADCKPDTY